MGAISTLKFIVAWLIAYFKEYLIKPDEKPGWMPEVGYYLSLIGKNDFPLADTFLFLLIQIVKRSLNPIPVFSTIRVSCS